MGVEGCTKCIKYMLFFFNFIFWLAGCVILGVSLWLRHDNKTSSLLELTYEGTEAPTTFYISIYILIAVGAVMMFVGFLGCYGAIQESQCLLGTFFACLVILFACEVAAGIWGFMHKDKISKELITFYDSVYDRGNLLTTDSEQRQAATAVLKVFHETLNCCGKGSIISGATMWFSDTCPQDKKTSDNCHAKIKELFSEKIYLIGIAALVVAIIMIFEMIFSMVLCCGIRNSPVY
ncbi:CD81 molecule a isoform X2 [Sinocyclocheilus rhinocerous]|uniref:Tetraspanin n=1 Tax=Sinocyclocheilus rhinocerous TaxID=307959 RepID=A0A673KKH7_9TELE|nr:PREDICTED: CD81 antigen-like isoform X2 [Sinocyclocheilus rhinocerous]